MTPSQKCKQAGLPSLAYLSNKYDIPYRTLENWNKNRPKVFDALVRIAVLELEEK